MSNVSTSSVVGPENARRYPSNSVDYPLRFFNMLHFERPKTLNEIYKWALVLDESHGLLSRITDTFARYPITHIIATGDHSGENKDFWSTLLNDKLNLPNELVKNGKDLYVYGNCFVSIVPPFKRYLVCPKCSTYKANCINNENFEDSPFQWTFRDFKFMAKCSNKECKDHYSGPMEVKDEFLEGEEFAKKVTICRWPIQHIKIRDLSVCGRKKIYYRLEEKYRKPIIKGDRFVVANVPYTFILSCKASLTSPIIELDPTLTYHYKHETVTEPEWEGLSKPFFFSCWKDVFMSFILRKAQEMIAADHLIPNRFVFPQNLSSGSDPLSKIDGSAWMNIITTQLKRQQNDPNEIGIVPFPIGYQALGGQGKGMSLREEIELQDRRIVTQMGMPQELIYGGMSWSGSSVALRMLENLFLYYINKQNKFISFFTAYVANKSGINPPTKVELSPFKMADDLAQTNILLGLGAQGRISETTSLSQVGNGINIEQEAKQMEADADSMKRLRLARQELDAEISSYLNRLQTNENIDTQIGANLLQQEHSATASSGIVNGAIMQTVEGTVNQINALQSPIEKRKVLLDLQSKSPGQFNAVIAKLNGTQQPLESTQPLPEQKPPRRGPDKAVI